MSHPASTTAIVHDLPLLPAIRSRLAALEPDAPDYFDDLLHLVNVDPALAVRVIEAANSSASSPVAQIDTLPTAVARLGTSHVGALVRSMSSTSTFTPTNERQRRLWTHAVEVATVSQLVAETFHLGPTFSQHMYLCGLLHDIGRFVMFEDHPERLAAVDDIGWADAEGLVAAEHHVWGVDHAQLGLEACQHWGVPSDVAALVGAHHHYDGPVPHTDELDHERLAIVQFADLLSLLRTGVVVADGADERDVVVRRATEHVLSHGLGILSFPLDALHHFVSSMLRSSDAAARVLGFDLPLDAAS